MMLFHDDAMHLINNHTERTQQQQNEEKKNCNIFIHETKRLH